MLGRKKKNRIKVGKAWAKYWICTDSGWQAAHVPCHVHQRYGPSLPTLLLQPNHKSTQTAECPCHKLCQQENIIQHVTYHFFFYPSFYNFSPNVLWIHEVGNIAGASLSAPLIKHPSRFRTRQEWCFSTIKRQRGFLAFSFRIQECVFALFAAWCHPFFFPSLSPIAEKWKFALDRSSVVTFTSLFTFKEGRVLDEIQDMRRSEGSETMWHPADLGQINSGASVRVGRRYEQFGFGLFSFSILVLH